MIESTKPRVSTRGFLIPVVESRSYACSMELSV